MSLYSFEDIDLWKIQSTMVRMMMVVMLVWMNFVASGNQSLPDTRSVAKSKYRARGRSLFFVTLVFFARRLSLRQFTSVQCGLGVSVIGCLFDRNAKWHPLAQCFDQNWNDYLELWFMRLLALQMRNSDGLLLFSSGFWNLKLSRWKDCSNAVCASPNV